MNADASTASVYTDFQGLLRLKAAAGKQTPEAAQETARQFESIFVQTMLKAMRDASPGDGMFESDQTRFYRDMYDQQLALHMVKGRGLGISKMLLEGMGQTQAVVSQAGGAPLVALEGTGKAQPLIGMPLPAEAGDHWRPGSPGEFVEDLLPHVKKAAAKIGVQPEVLIAQSALETGWGRKVIRHADGRSSFNLFNIKADARWPGESVAIDTLEFTDGIAQKERAAFRAYPSIAAGVADYVDFLKSNPRYRDALGQAGDAESFLHGLKDAGYATDPAYVEKIKAILQQSLPGMNNAAALASPGHSGGDAQG